MQAQEDKEAEQVAGEGEGEREGEREGEGEEEREAEQQGEMEKGGGRRGREGEEGREAGGRRHEGDILLVPVGPKGKARARPEGGLLEGGATGKVAIFADQREVRRRGEKREATRQGSRMGSATGTGHPLGCLSFLTNVVNSF